MEVLAAVRARRAVKAFDPTHVMPAHAVDALLEAAALTPSSFNIQHWRTVNVVDQTLRQQIRAAAWDQSQFTDASLLLMVCADTQAWAKEPHRYWQHAHHNTQRVLTSMIAQFYSGNPQLQRDEALRSVGLYAQTLMLAAQGLGYDSCPMIGFDAQKVGALINLPSDHVIGMAVAVGRALKPAQPRSGLLSRADSVLTDRF